MKSLIGWSKPILTHWILRMPIFTTCAAVLNAAPLPPGYRIPVVDIARETHRQVVVDREPGQYLGHPTTVLLEDGATMLCVFPKGHGRGAIVLKRSHDGGRTWSERLPVPENWSTSLETPTIHRVVDAAGHKRLIVWSGLFPARLAVSEDDGATWSPLRPAGDWGGIVVMGSAEAVRGEPGRYLAWFHDDGRYGRRDGKQESPVVFRLFQVESRDGGLNWGQPRELFAASAIHLCEPGVVRSPDGRQLAMLLRENSRRRNSHLMFSDDEGRTWTAPRELPGALTGDRHTARYVPDGRLFISFRDTTRESPTRGDWVGWVGRYEDLVAGREGNYRVRIMDNTRAADCAYPGVEVLPDGTLVTTTYGHWTTNESPYVVSVRFQLAELDAKLGAARNRRDDVASASVPGSPGVVAAAALGRVGAVPDDVRARFKLAPFYRKHLDVHGLPVVSSSNVTDFALLETGWIVRQMLADREAVFRAMASNNVRLAVMAWNEFTTDLPEHSDLTPKVYWDRRARGLGATPARPAVSCAEENVLCYPGDPYATENICVHEFAHAVHEMGLSALDPTFDPRLAAAFHSATNRGLWKNTYAASNRHEYWAEGAQSWFDDNRENDALHNHVNTRAELKAYDPELARLCAEVFGDGPWRYSKPERRVAADRAHLAGFDPALAPRFVWREPPLVPKPRVSMQTTLGELELELDATHAPATVKNFLRYVTAGWYGDGAFHRTVTRTNQPGSPIKIEVVQASANPAKTNEFFPPIPLERTRDTGLKHLDATVSMARGEPDSAQDHFFICIGDQPELDFGGRRNPDGQGFAAFGRVIKGMDTVRQIHRAPAEGQQLTPPIKIQRAIRIE